MIKIESYASKKQYEKAAKKMAKKGWKVKDVRVEKDRPFCCCFPILGFLSFIKLEVYHVTYER